MTVWIREIGFSKTKKKKETANRDGYKKKW
jgi:hypothetical protein